LTASGRDAGGQANKCAQTIHWRSTRNDLPDHDLRIDFAGLSRSSGVHSYSADVPNNESAPVHFIFYHHEAFAPFSLEQLHREEAARQGRIRLGTLCAA
jgi:hypothetical protein